MLHIIKDEDYHQDSGSSQQLCSTLVVLDDSHNLFPTIVLNNCFWGNSHQLYPTQLYPLRQVNKDNISYITVPGQSAQCRETTKLRCTYTQWIGEKNNSARTYNGTTTGLKIMSSPVGAQNVKRCLSTDQGSATCVGQCRALWDMEIRA